MNRGAHNIFQNSNMTSFNISNETMVVTSVMLLIAVCRSLKSVMKTMMKGGSLWQFHCGNGDYSMDLMQLVRLDTVLKIDPSLREVADLQLGATAKRLKPGAAWVIE